MANLKVAFWNLQNLFDTSLSPIAADFKFTPDFGWTDQAKNTKIANLAAVINSMFNNTGPDILGICEVENSNVVNELLAQLNRNDLVLAHVDSPDIRGIDCSLIYSSNLFDLVGQPVEHLVHLRYPTRDIFEVKLKVKSNDSELVVLVNHWPSRSRGRYESEPYRITVASHCGKITDQHLKLDRNAYIAENDSQATLNKINKLWNNNVLIMGDFNDEPYDRSVLEELQAASGKDKIEEILKKGGSRNNTPPIDAYLKKKAPLYNCSWLKAGLPDTGSYFYSDAVNTMNLLDQVIISRGLLYGENGLEIAKNPDGLPEFEIYAPALMLTSNQNVRPKKFAFRKNNDGTFWNNNGFSDHFPVFTRVEVL